MAKDLFSEHSHIYSKYRPGYPRELIEYILGFVPKRKTAWDSATGNGQAASLLADFFEKVEATDISEEQLKNAVRKSNIHYQVASAEQTPFPDDYFDLITVATAYHWLNQKAFHKEANRTGKHGCVVAVWAYYSCRTDDDNVNRLYDDFYTRTIAPYWDADRKFLDEKYETVEFDFDPLPVLPFEIKLQWKKEHFRGYIESWSSVRNYIRQHQASPLDLINEELNRIWNDEEEKTVTFPLVLKLGRIVKNS